MSRRWIGLALLAGSWLFGLQYYHEPEWLPWAILLAAGTLLLTGTVQVSPRALAEGGGAPAGPWSLAAIAALLPVIWLAPWPYRAAPLLIAIGLALHQVRIPRDWPRRVGSAAITAGFLLAAQSVALFAYRAVTARSHELIWPLPGILDGVAQLLGIDAASYGGNLALNAMRKVQLIGASWELLVDPVTLCFFVGGIVILAVEAWTIVPPGKRTRFLLKGVGILAICVAVWLPVRAGLMMALCVHRVLITAYEATLIVMDQFWKPWLHLALLAGPVFLAWRFLRPAEAGEVGEVGRPGRTKLIAAICLVFVAFALLTAAVFWDPIGGRKPGRILMDEHLSTWEPSGKPYDTEYYGHDSGYNYACIYDYCSRFYDMSRVTTPIDDALLANGDVLIVKVPTSPYPPEEIAAIRRFVERGGGLMLIGEHTDVFGTGRNINAIADEFGFRFRYDCLFGIDTGFDQKYELPLLPHPIVQYVPDLDFAVSCSLMPGVSSGREVIRSTGLWRLPADYWASNYYPQKDMGRPDMEFGAFTQLWATRYGKGRVVAYTDSTQFSNFCTFEPGKAELVLGMTEWLNHNDGVGNPRWWLTLLGIAALAGGVFMAWTWEGAWLPLLVTAMLAWSLSVIGIGAYNRAAMPVPKNIKPIVMAYIDQTTSSSLLSKSGFIQGKGEGFGIFERWILRLGYFTRRASGKDALKGDILVVLNPNKPVSDRFRNDVVAFVEKGGKLLVMDSPENMKSSANSLLSPFGVTIKHGGSQGTVVAAGPLTVPEGWPAVSINSALELTGGKPWAAVRGKTVGVSAEYGKGSVVALTFGSQFVDSKMGGTGDVVPSADLRKVFDLEFTLMRAIAEGKPISLPIAAAPAAVPARPAAPPTPAARPAAPPKPVAPAAQPTPAAPPAAPAKPIPPKQ